VVAKLDRLSRDVHFISSLMTQSRLENLHVRVGHFGGGSSRRSATAFPTPPGHALSPSILRLIGDSASAARIRRLCSLHK
jgi:hypothetical protein